jgi:Trk K+ transport system NAD-binding subunit
MPASRGLTRPIIVGRRFVISGLSRLTVRVAQLLAEERAEVVVVAAEDEAPLAPLLGDTAHVVWDKGDHELALQEAGLPQAGCFLVLGEEELDNMRNLVIGSGIAPAVPVVLRMFNPVLAEHFQQTLNVRRAYSVSALAAPAFVAAVLEEQVLETMHLGEDEVPVCRLTLGQGSRLAGQSASAVEREYGVAVLARRPRGGTWARTRGPERLGSGDDVLTGGPLNGILRLAMADSRLFPRLRGVPRPPLKRVDRKQRRERRRAARTATLLPTVGVALAVFLVATVLTFGVTLGLNPLEAVYHTILTAFGEQTLGAGREWLKVLAILTMVAAGLLVGIVFSHLASVATASLLADRAGRRAQRLTGHVVVAGLSNVGFRAAQHLQGLAVPVVVVDPSPSPRLREALGDGVPVVSGDIRVPEILERAGMRGAVGLIASTEDDLTNVLACIQARQLSPEARTVAHVFDEDLAGRLGKAFGVDAALSATGAAAGAFASAATDERAVRPLMLGDLEYRALRYDVVEELDLEELAGWATEGVRVLAYRRGQGPVRPPAGLTEPLRSGDAAIVIGPARAVDSLVLAS